MSRLFRPGSPLPTLMLPCVLLLLLGVGQARGGKYNLKLNVGDEAPAWSELPGTDGKSYSLKSFADAKAFVVVFTCNTCPYAVDVEDRLNTLYDQFSGQGVAIVAINSNTVQEDRMPAMIQRAKEKGFRFPYLWDESQQVAKAYGANYTPEIFVFGQDRKLVYMGAFDDSPDGREIGKHHTVDAVNAVLEGGTVEEAETVPIGCRIRFNRERRKRRE